jgi:4-amino-4-deoxy-L-arabinose transferase-like glycosyltransferase
MQKELLEKIKNITRSQWILLGLIIVGIFLRTYHLQQLLVFASDQSRDYTIIKNVVNNGASWPLLGPDMTGGRGFRLGAIYYYFQIVSAKIFGVGVTQQAYPDLLFSILSIPLLYYFLKRYFAENVALLSTVIYVFSYFAVEYSRFAWNVNLIPFFVLLFLYSSAEFLLGEEKTHWKWIVSLGIAIGVGIQLHAILLLLLPAMTFFIFLFLFLRNKKVWKKCVAVILIAISLNVGQLISENETGFKNTKTFFTAFIFKSDRTDSTLMKGLELDVACNAQADMHIVSSLGNKSICDFLYGNNEVSTTYNSRIKLDRNPLSLLGKFASLLFSLVGLSFLFYRFLDTNGKRRHLWGLLILYGTLYFLIMIPIAPGSRMRYYLPIIFMPFVFLSFIFEFMMKRYPRKHVYLIGVILVFLLVVNINSMRLRLMAPSCSKEIQTNFGCNLPIK